MSVCSISGTVCEEPVISVKSGHIYEKRLLEKHLEIHHTCPVTKEPMSIQDTMPVKSSAIVRPRAPAAASIPGMMQVFQNEWDAAMLEQYSLKQQLHSVRQELAHALYRNDAASRVIARLIQERDDARSALQTQRVSGGQAAGAGSAAMEDEGDSGISAKITADIDALAKTLSKNRKKLIKQRQADVASPETIGAYTASASFTPHSASTPGVLCIDVHDNNDLVATGGADQNVVVLSKSTGKIVDTLKGHKKKVTSVVMHPSQPLVFSASVDTTAKIWQARDDGKYKNLSTLQGHTGAVVSASLHPSGNYLMTASADKTWAFWDIATSTLRQSVKDADMEQGYTCASFHPDGLLYGTGSSDSLVRIFDVKTQKNVALFKAHAGEISGISFSENGYYLASGDSQGSVRLWDLRKLENFHTLPADANASGVTALRFDASGSYLGVGLNDGTVRLVNSKTWAPAKEWQGVHTAAVTGISFGSNASFFATSSQDRTVKLWSKE